MHDETTTLLITERHADDAGWAASLGADGRRVVRVAQRAGEAPRAFATRVRAEVLRLPGALVEAAYVGGSSWDPEALAARALAVRALVARLPEGGVVHLDAPGRARHAMQALAELAASQLSTAGVSVVAGPPPADVAPLAA